MKRTALISFCMALGLGLWMAPMAQAQQSVPAMDGQMVRLRAENLWLPIPLPSVEITQSQTIAKDLSYPSISPDGHQVLLYEQGNPGEPNTLHLWTQDSSQISPVLSDHEVSGYISWQDEQTWQMRKRSAPFIRHASVRTYAMDNPKKLNLRANTTPVQPSLTVYDANDIIVLENAKNQTLQAISDSRHDRYYAPIISPDQRYIVFNGLTTGIHLFDVAKNAVVYVGASGTNPAFSPDGRYLIYAQTTDNGHEYTSGDLILIDLKKHTSRSIANPHKEIRLRGTISDHAKKIVYETDKREIITGSLSL